MGKDMTTMIASEKIAHGANISALNQESVLVEVAAGAATVSNVVVGFQFVLFALGLILGLLGMFFPSAIPASMVAKGEYQVVGSQETVMNPNIYSWGVHNVAAVVPIPVAFYLGSRDAWLAAASSQVFRDLPDTIAEFVIKKDYATGVAFSFRRCRHCLYCVPCTVVGCLLCFLECRVECA